jgi:hypothetical protein
MGRPATVWRSLARRERIRVPNPAASTTTAQRLPGTWLGGGSSVSCLVVALIDAAGSGVTALSLIGRTLLVAN